MATCVSGHLGSGREFEASGCASFNQRFVSVGEALWCFYAAISWRDAILEMGSKAFTIPRYLG